MMRFKETIALLGAILAAGNALAEEPSPILFAPGVISGPSGDGAPTFTPDGKTIYFDRSNNRGSYIVTSHFDGTRWAEPTIASFAGPMMNQQPALSPDGNFLIYSSTRARADGTNKVSHIFRVDKTDTGWSEPQELSGAVNIALRVFKPSVAANGDIYFMSTEAPRGTPAKWRLYRAALSGGVYQKAEPLAFSDGTSSDVDPAIAPDESYIVFSSQGRKNFDDAHERLFIAFHDGNGWTTPAPMRYAGDSWGADDGEANISPDGKTLYFASSRSAPPDPARDRAQMQRDYADMQSWDNNNDNVWTLPLAPYLAREKPGS